MNTLSIEKLIKYLRESSEENYQTMQIMEANKRYTWALFLGHLVLEKLLKALYVKKQNEHPPYIHNLIRLAEKCPLELSDERREQLATITAFNISTRYDDYQQTFYQMCTAEFTKHWIEIIKEHREWISKQLN
jgi:HEPN domain-containing protein